MSESSREPELPPLALWGYAALAGFALVVRAVHLPRLRREFLELHALVAKDHDLERFARGDSSRNRATGSTGLGLAIVQAVVQAHGGEVTVASEPGSTVFTVSLPLVPATA